MKSFNFSSDAFQEVLLAVLFLALVILNVHLIHKLDAGGDDMGFIIWSMNASSTVLGALILKITGKSPTANVPSLNESTGGASTPQKES